MSVACIVFVIFNSFFFTILSVATTISFILIQIFVPTVQVGTKFCGKVLLFRGKVVNLHANDVHTSRMELGTTTKTDKKHL